MGKGWKQDPPAAAALVAFIGVAIVGAVVVLKTGAIWPLLPLAVWAFVVVAIRKRAGGSRSRTLERAPRVRKPDVK